MPPLAIPQKELDRLANEVLSALEVEEARLLTWGFVEVWTDLPTRLPEFLDRLTGVGQAIWQSAKDAGVTPTDVLNNLRERRLVLENTRQRRWRSRFAEAVRLLFLLRQRFSFTDWAVAPRLVSDLRIQLQRRRYPRREPAVTAALLQTLSAERFSGEHVDAVRALLQEVGGGELALAQFQYDAALQLLRHLREGSDHGLVIGAGTGSGKTKAFYIPAMAEVAASIQPNRYSVAAMAIYPRVELLKDQLIEAYGEVRKLDALLIGRGQRPIILGAYYGDTPISAARLLSGAERRWDLAPGGDGWLCPYFRCPRCERPEMAWRREDVQREAVQVSQGEFGRFSRLICGHCQTEVPGERLALTREHMAQEPPDILFTTTEMLNRRLSNSAERALFGRGGISPPRLLLLDEVHTYEGRTGGQVAYLIRRWRHARGFTPGQGLCIVGLSATLAEAEAFLSRLTGLPEYAIGYVTPRDEDMLAEGMEYNLVLKGDPVSSVSLLSTSVQTVMLLGRVLDSRRAPNADISRHTYGQKLFAFTDKLDVINRWFHIEQDAETRNTLAQYRRWPPTLPPADRERRDQHGQDWAACEFIGHNLRTPLRVDLTSSQSRGVEAAAELVIATSTLEVGYNDRAVGAVVQHKAPRSQASFLQRKGRAGRVREMRPWMVVVTSAYGRDRWAFQHAENLFDPVLQPIELPLENHYIRQIQAAYSLMDWLAVALGRQGVNADLWDLLSSGPSNRTPGRRALRLRVADLLKEVLAGRRLPELVAHLTRALGLAEEALAVPLLWGEPRALILDVIPTLLRQLETDWQVVSGTQIMAWAESLGNSPMPEFVPPTLFGDLNTPELVLRITEVPGHSGATVPPVRDEVTMPLAQALVEYAPGNVTKRYARPNVRDEAHWLALPDEAQLSRGALSLDLLPIERDRVAYSVQLDGQQVAVYRPRVYRVDVVPAGIRSTSTARLIWRSAFEPQSAQVPASEGGAVENSLGNHIELAQTSPWRDAFVDIRAYTQVNGAWVAITRAAIGVNVDTRYERGDALRRRLVFEDLDVPAALGFTLLVDALRFDLASFDAATVLKRPDWGRLFSGLAPDYGYYCLRQDVRIAALSHFEVEWLWELQLSMLTAIAVASQCSLAEAAATIRTNRLQIAERTLDVIFQTLRTEGGTEEETRGRLHDRLIELLRDQAVVDALDDSCAKLWSPADAGLAAWLSICHRESLGAALFDAVTRLVPDVDPDDLHLDVEPGRVWISEATAGGVGLIGRLADAIALRPREFDLQLQDTLEHCDREQLAHELATIGNLVERSEPTLAEAFADLRRATDLLQQNETRRRLMQILEAFGVPASRELIVALNAKFLRPNSGPDSDRLIATLAAQWEREVSRLGVSIDLRVMAVAALRLPAIAQQVEEVLQRVGGTAEGENQKFNLLQSLLWLRCDTSCPDCIEVRPLYQELEHPSRLLLRTLVIPSIPVVEFGSPNWRAKVGDLLAQTFMLELRCRQDELGDCKRCLLELLTSPVEVGYQLLYPAVERVSRAGRDWVIRLVIRELTER